MLGEQQNQVAQQVEDVLMPSLQAMGFDIVRITMMGGHERPILQIMAERADHQGLNVEDCAQISRAASAILDVEDVVGGAYVLEVSSPGIDRPLTRPADFARFVGSVVKVTMEVPADGRRRFTGAILSATDTQVDMDVDGQKVTLNFDQMQKAKLVIADDILKKRK